MTVGEGYGFKEGGRRRGWGEEVGIRASLAPPPDCDSHWKPARGSYRISLKKFCRKDYGRPPALALSPLPSLCHTIFLKARCVPVNT